MESKYRIISPSRPAPQWQSRQVIIFRLTALPFLVCGIFQLHQVRLLFSRAIETHGAMAMMPPHGVHLQTWSNG
jgi:hypothetical protein